MTWDRALDLFTVLLGGGLVSVLSAWAVQRKARRVEVLQADLDALYGPLCFLTSLNSRLFDLTRKIDEAYAQEYTGKTWSQDAGTQQALEKASSETLQLANTYVHQITENNIQVFTLLRDHYRHVHRDDFGVFMQFVVDYTRWKTEVDQTGRLTTPLEIHRRLGGISFMRPDFINAVEKRFTEMRTELDSLLASGNWSGAARWLLVAVIAAGVLWVGRWLWSFMRP